MPQNSRHPLYDLRLPQWQRCRDATAGSDAIKARGELYLPRPSGLADLQYQAFKARAVWFNASSRTLEGWTAPAFRTPPVLVGPERLEAQMGNVTGTGMTFEAFALLAFEETFIGHAGILLDLPDRDALIDTVTPQWSLYQAEQIINWEVARQADGTMALVRVMLEETVAEHDPLDPYAHVSVMQWRELVIEQGVYTVKLWRFDENGFRLVEVPAIPNRMKQPLKFIPFDMDLLAASMPPFLLDIADLNIAHYQINADYRHALHWTAIKTGYVITPNKLPPEMRLGGLDFLHIEALPSQAAIGLIEPNGASLQAHLDALRDTEKQMAILGARMLEPQKKSAETAEAMALHQSGEQSVLQSLVELMSQRLTRVLRWHAWWAVIADTLDDQSISVQLNRDLAPQKLSPQEIDALVAAWHQGALTQEALHYNLQQGELLAPDETLDVYIARIATQSELREPVLESEGL